MKWWGRNLKSRVHWSRCEHTAHKILSRKLVKVRTKDYKYNLSLPVNLRTLYKIGSFTQSHNSVTPCTCAKCMSHCAATLYPTDSTTFWCHPVRNIKQNQNILENPSGNSYTVPTQRTVNLILMLRTICKMSGSLFDCWSDLISDKYVSWRIHNHLTINTLLKEFPIQIFALISFDLRIRSLKYF